MNNAIEATKYYDKVGVGAEGWGILVSNKNS